MLFRTFLLLLVIATIVPGCVQQRDKYLRDGREYGVTSGNFSGRWWSYYERGRSFADGRFLTEAENDFAQAVAGRAEDQWRARTYGMHFVDYFPHRELGIIHYQRKDYDKAIAELQESIRTAPSAKAHYFLNKARGAEIQTKGGDMGAPELALEGSSAQELTNSFTKVVKGVATDDNYVASIRVGEQNVPMELAVKKKVFTAEVPLQPGENVIPVVATDLLGKLTEKQLRVFCDRQGPQVEVEELTTGAGGVTIKGSVSDNKGLASMRINGRNWPISGFAPGYDFKVTLPDGDITIIARDKAGNVTNAVLQKAEYDLQRTIGSGITGLKFAAADTGGQAIATDASAAAIDPSPGDRSPPYIWLENIAAEEETYDDMVLLEGKVMDDSLLVYLTVNGEPILNRKGKRVYYSLLKQLQEGKNTFLIVAADAHGNKASRTVTVTRKISEIRQVGARMSVAILPFEKKGEPSLASEMIHDQLIDSFLEQARFSILERQKIDAVLQELKLSTSELVDPAQAADLGKIVTAQAILTGTVLENSNSIEVIGRLVDTETSEILASNDIFGEDKEIPSVAGLVEGLAYKFKRDFPLVEGILLEVKQGEVLVDAGKEKRLLPNTRLICYREGPPIRHPVTGRLLGSEPQVVGRLKVESVYDEFSRAAIVHKESDLVVSDKVIAQ